MPIKQTHEVCVDRLRKELQALGMDHRGSRSDLVNSLMQSGVYEINTDIPPKPLKLDRTCNFPNHRSILLGIGASIDSEEDNKLVIDNSNGRLIEGDFQTKVVTINDCLQLKESSLDATTPGVEGQLRMSSGKLYMYRHTDCFPGWYPLQFGTMLIV